MPYGPDIPAMRMLTLLLLPACLLMSGSPAMADAAQDAALGELIEAHWQRTLRERPEFASVTGDRRYDEHWTDLAPRALAASHRADRDALRALRRIDVSTLSADAAIDHALLRRELAWRVDMHGYGQHLLPMTQLRGVQMLDQLPGQLVFRDLRDYDNWLARLQSLDTHIAQTIALMRQGMRRGIVVPQAAMRRVPPQLRALLVEDAQDSGFYAPFLTLPDDVHPARAQALRTAARAAISQQVLPAYRRLHDFLVEEYLPIAPERVAAAALPEGQAWYARMVAWHSSTELSPQEIHDIGLAEVNRLLEDMQHTMRKAGHEGDLAEFFAVLREDPAFYHDDPQALLTAFRATAKRIDPALPQLFGRLPRTPYGIEAVASATAPDSMSACYRPPAADGSHAGYMHVNLSRPQHRPIFDIEVLTAGTAVPGRHLQTALVLEQRELHPFRRHQHVAAYSEGWALYAADLGAALGLYADPHSMFGRLGYEMWQAAGLVVDTGVHALGWEREQAIAFMRAHTPRSEHDIISEVDRYIARPGQALAGKIGKMQILSLRDRARERLGNAFDIREFHDVMLSGGAVPLDLLDERIERWIAGRSVSPREETS